MHMTTTAQTTTRVLLASLAGGVALLAFGAAGAGAAPSAALEPTSGCYKQVINDWVDNNQVDRIYALPCYSQALQYLSTLPDVTGYSSASEDIKRAWLLAVRDRGGGGPTGGAGGPSDGNPSKSPSGVPSKGPTNDSIVESLGHKLGPGNAQSIPLPLLVLGGLALLLLLAAAGTWIARRMQARRPRPGPPAPGRPS
jgi:hypothetical protein